MQKERSPRGSIPALMSFFLRESSPENSSRLQPWLPALTHEHAEHMKTGTYAHMHTCIHANASTLQPRQEEQLGEEEEVRQSQSPAHATRAQHHTAVASLAPHDTEGHRSSLG